MEFTASLSVLLPGIDKEKGGNEKIRVRKCSGGVGLSKGGGRKSAFLVEKRKHQGNRGKGLECNALSKRPNLLDAGRLPIVILKSGGK